MQARIDPVDAGAVEAEDLRFHVRGERAVPEPLHERLGHRESAQSLDLPLGRAPPDRIRAPEHVIGAERLDEHAEHVAADQRRGDHHLSEGGAQLGVDVGEAGIAQADVAQVGDPVHA